MITDSLYTQDLAVCKLYCLLWLLNKNNKRQKRFKFKHVSRLKKNIEGHVSIRKPHNRWVLLLITVTLWIYFVVDLLVPIVVNVVLLFEQRRTRCLFWLIWLMDLIYARCAYKTRFFEYETFLWVFMLKNRTRECESKTNLIIWLFQSRYNDKKT